MRSPFRWITAIVNAAKSVSPASFVRNDFSQLSTTSFFTQLGKCRRRNSMRCLRKRARFSSIKLSAPVFVTASAYQAEITKIARSGSEIYAEA